MTKTIKRWYLILTGIWVLFWIIDIFFLIPENPTEEIYAFLNDGMTFSIYWLWITAPILLYLIFICATKLVGIVRKSSEDA